MKLPKEHQVVMPYLMVKGALKFLDFAKTVFDAKLTTDMHKVREDGETVIHSEITIGGSTIMFTDATEQWKEQTANLFVYVDNADETYKKAIDSGATTVMELSDQDYGRTCGVTDPLGNVWWITSLGKQIETRPTDKQIAEDLKYLDKQWDKAIEGNDALKIGRFMTDDWVIIGTEGGITSKTNFLGYVKSGDLHHDKMDFEDIRVEVYGNTGIVTSKGTSSGTYKGEPFSYYEWATNVYIKNDGFWLCVLTMLTPVEGQSS